MKFRRVLALLALIAAPLASQAFTPESGFYYMYTSDNANAGGGTGLAIDIQNENLFAAGYIYATTGQPAFVTMQGPLTQKSDGSWTRTDNVFISTSGQCVDTQAKCPYKKPTVAVGGKFTINFIAENTGTMTWGATGNEQTVTLVRVGFYPADKPGSLVGEWDTVFYNGASGSSPQRYSADKIIVQSSKSGAIIGCLALGEAESGCGSGTQVIPVFGNYTTKSGTLGSQTTYQLVVFDNSLSNYQRVYTFSENGFGGQFTGTIKGTVSICGANVTSVANCNAVKDKPFVAYRSGSSNYALSGQGMD